MKLSRRDFLAGASAILSTGAFARPVRSLLSTRDFLDSILKPTAADYIQEGLVVMWDAIENGGPGIHDPSATYIKDLIGNRDLPCAAGSVSDSWVRYSSTYRIVADAPLIGGFDFTISGVFDRSETTGNFCAIGFGYSTGCLVTGSPTAFGCRFGTGYQIKNTSEVLSSVTWRRMPYDNIRFFDGDVDRGIFVGDMGRDISTLTSLNINGENPYGNYRNIFSLGNLRIYDRPLSADEIRYNYLIDKLRFAL